MESSENNVGSPPASQRQAASPAAGKLRTLLALIGALAVGSVAGWWGHQKIASPAASGIGSPDLSSSAPPADERRAWRSPLEIEREAQIEKRLNAHPWKKPDCVTLVEPCSQWHTRQAEAQIERKGRQIDVFVYVSGFDDLPGMLLSIIEVDGAKVAHANIGFTEAGSPFQGADFSPRFKIVPLGEHGYAVVVEERELHQGHTGTQLSIHLFSEGRRLGGYEDQLESDHEALGELPRSAWKGGWMLIDVPGGAPELVIAKKGIEHDAPLDAIERYRWNGKTFAPLRLPTPPAAPSASSNDASAVAL